MIMMMDRDHQNMKVHEITSLFLYFRLLSLLLIQTFVALAVPFVSNVPSEHVSCCIDKPLVVVVAVYLYNPSHFAYLTSPTTNTVYTVVTVPVKV